jgi:uncharacterized membrane protein
MPLNLDEKDIRAIAGSCHTRTHAKWYIAVLTAVVFSLGVVWTLFGAGKVSQYFFGVPVVVLVTGMVLLWRSSERYKKTLVQQWKDDNKKEGK